MPLRLCRRGCISSLNGKDILMDIGLILKVAGVIVVMIMLVGEIGELINTVRSVFGLSWTA